MATLVTYIKKFKKEDYSFLKSLKYKKIYVLSEKSSLAAKYIDSKKITVLFLEKLSDIKKNIDSILEKEKGLVLPYFSGDSRAKYNIYVYNKVFGGKVHPDTFKQKNRMNAFLGEVALKKNKKYDYKTLQLLSYDEVKNDVGEVFILKPTNAAASLLTFKVSNQEDFEHYKEKLSKKYDYILEEYVQGNLYSIDFFCNGKDIFLLSFVREVTFSEILEKKKFSSKFLEKYEEEIQKYYLHSLPVCYALEMTKLSPLELSFLQKIRDKLASVSYRGLIHLEYKIDRKKGTLGFIEWGARAGGYRDLYLKEMSNVYIQNLPYDILVEKDFSKFTLKKGLYFLKEKHFNHHLFRIKTNVLKKTRLLALLKKTGSYLSLSFQNFLLQYFWDTFRIRIQNIEFRVRSSSDSYIYPSYERSDTGFSYILSLDDENFKKITKNKSKVVEKVIFHDYS